jgi:hypothetical protein
LEILSSIFGKLLSSISVPLWNKVSGILVRPKIKLKKAPKNIFEYLKPTSSKDRVKELLGAPHNVLGSKWCYEFSDSLIQIDFYEESGAKYIVLGLKDIKTHYNFSIPIFDKPLGKLTLADLSIQEGRLEYNSGHRYEELVFITRYGPPGIWQQYHFGMVSTIYGSSIYDSNFEWDHETEQVVTPPENVIVNWVGISHGSDEVCLDWEV